MNICESIRECFQPGATDPDFAPMRIGAMVAGLVGLISAVASAIFGTASAAEVTAIAAFSGSLLAGGLIGSVGLMALPILIGLGVALALAPPTTVAWVIWI